MSRTAQTPKLGKLAKAELREFKRGNPDAQFGLVGRVTVLLVPVGNGFARMVTAVAAVHETKIRRKVGEWLCMARFYGGESILVSSTQDAFTEASILNEIFDEAEFMGT